MVAAWISAETGVGPAMASGSQVRSGICALFPVQPRKMSRVEAKSNPAPVVPTANRAACEASRNQAEMAEYSRLACEPMRAIRAMVPKRKPRSPARLTKKALRAALLLASSLCQKPMSR